MKTLITLICLMSFSLPASAGKFTFRTTYKNGKTKDRVKRARNRTMAIKKAIRKVKRRKKIVSIIVLDRKNNYVCNQTLDAARRRFQRPGEILCEDMIRN